MITLSFAIVLVGCVTGKITMLLMTSQIRPMKTVPFCNVEIDRSRNYMAEISESEQVVWIWSVFFVFLFPECMTFLRSLRMCLFKSPARSNFSDALIVIAFECCHICGVALFVFLVLPNTDVVKGAMLTNCVAIVPGIFGECKIRFVDPISPDFRQEGGPILS